MRVFTFSSLLKNACLEGEAPAEPHETSDFPHMHGSAGASPSHFQQAVSPDAIGVGANVDTALIAPTPMALGLIDSLEAA